jgi:hypothetical protein
MTKTKLRRGRFLFVSTVAMGLALLVCGSQAALAQGSALMLDDFEFYNGTDALRLTWSVVEPESPLAVVDLECSLATDWPTSFCSGHYNQGEAAGGAHFLRLNYLLGTTIARMTWSGDPDWTGYKWLTLYYRGESEGQAAPADLTLQLVANGGSDVLTSPPVSNATQCEAKWTPPDWLDCNWAVADWNIEGWSGLSNVSELRIVLTGEEGQGRFFVDEIQLRDTPVPVVQKSWGAIKAMYR